MQLFIKILSGMANNVDPHQTALKEQSDQGLHYLHMLLSDHLVYKILGHLITISVKDNFVSDLKGICFLFFVPVFRNLSKQHFHIELKTHLLVFL